MNDEEPGDWLRARLRAADPARNLTHPRHLELTEAHMSTIPAPTGPNRSRLALVAAAVVVLVLAGVGVVAGLGDDDEPSTTATPKTPDSTPPSSPDTGATATYTLDPAGQTSGRCLPPSAEGIRGLDAAFAGVVAERTGDRVVLDVTRTWKAPQEQSRAVLDVERAEGAISEALPLTFEVGKEYIIAVKQGDVRLCGWSSETTPTLEQEYDQAFPGR